MEMGGYLIKICTVLFLLFLLLIICHDATPQTTGLQTGTLPATAAVVHDNTTKAPTLASNTTSVKSSTQTASGNSKGNVSLANTTAKTPTTEFVSNINFTDPTSLPTDNGTIGNRTESTTMASPTSIPAYYESCPSGLPCEKMSAECLNCTFDHLCIYGREYNTTCMLKEGLDCIGTLPVERTYQCRYCYQTEKWQQTCTPANNCQVNACPQQYVTVNCTLLDDVICLGSRTFYRRKACNWTSGYKWTKALALSITLGGFGADRFYLGYWQSGLGKLFSFGGAGVWTLIDVLLIAVGYITPSDGSHYIY